MGRKLASALVAGLIAWILIPQAPAEAQAAPTATITVSEDGNGVPSGGIVDGEIRIRVRGTSAIDLNEVRLEGRQGGAWLCMRRWTDSQAGASFDENFDWDTRTWNTAVGCSNSNEGQRTSNTTFDLRVRATDPTGTATDSTNVKLNNPAQKPEWNSDPDHEQDESGDPLVVFSFTAGDDPDIVEHRYYRTDPDGEQWFTAIDPSNPGEADCERDGDVYQCFDGVFAGSGYGGTYDYELESFRDSPAGGNGCDCIGSGATESRSVAVPEPDPSPSPSPSPTQGSGDGDDDDGGGSGRTGRRHVPQRVLGRRSGGGSGNEFFTGTFDRSLPYDDRNILIPGVGNRRARNELAIGVEGEGKRTLVIPIAAGLLLFLGAAHARRLLSVR